jgi:hypothetical protein
MSWFDCPPRRGAHTARIEALEKRERELAQALLDYLRADLAATWMESAKRLETLLEERLK